jgi:hypothetical protein
MSVFLELSDQQAGVLRAKAAAEGLSLQEWIQKLAQNEPEPIARGASRHDPRRRHISEVIQEIMSDVPREEFETLPRDGASEHDHYLYGAPKKNQ